MVRGGSAASNDGVVQGGRFTDSMVEGSGASSEGRGTCLELQTASCLTLVARRNDVGKQVLSLHVLWRRKQTRALIPCIDLLSSSTFSIHPTHQADF
jgi:hypothetical protein